MKKAATGLAGAVRIRQLKLDDLTRAEKHGKRLDISSRSRAIYKDAPPLTTTGLDLNRLYRKHVEDAFIPKAKAKAMHVIVQFPTDLVNGEDAGQMLRHARTFVEKVFETESIFADRVDRDEKGRHVVDLFIAPKYVKTTKHTERIAITMSFHLKELAKSYGRQTNVHETGRALQDAFFDYLRHDMGLEEAQRGSPKLLPGPDWKSAEELRDRELANQEASVENDRVRAREAREEAEDHKAEAEMKHAVAAAERARQEKAALELQAAFSQLELDQQQARFRIAKAEEAERRASLAAEGARREVNLMREEEHRIASEGEQFGSAMALLIRGVDDGNGLHLQSREQEDRGFLMVEAKLLPAEAATYRNWPKALRSLASTLAKVVEGVREMRDRLLRREQELDQKQVSIEAHERQLKHSEAELTQQKYDLEAKAVRAAEQLEFARRELDRAQQEHRTQAEWAGILQAIADGSLNVVLLPNGKLTVSNIGDDPASERMRARMETQPPAWVQSSIKLMRALSEVESLLDEEKANVAIQVDVLKKVVEQADEAFTPAQKGAVAAASEALALTPAQLAARLAHQRDRGLG